MSIAENFIAKLLYEKAGFLHNIKEPPDRIIMHVDMNSYFASVEQQANPSLRGKAMGVGGPNDGRTVLAAVSIEAKRYGCKSGMSLYEAKSICPHLIVVQGDFLKYASATKRLIKILARYAPDMEIFSIDEAFLDVTDTSGTYEKAVESAIEIKKSIKNEIGEWLTCSVGIAPNKLLAKLASDFRKPNGLVVVRKGGAKKILSLSKLDDICGIGGRTKKNLLKLGIDSLEKLGSTSLSTLLRRFGKPGFFLYLASRGLDYSEIEAYYRSRDPKSMGHSYTLPEDTDDREIIFSILLRLSEQVGVRLRTEAFSGRVVKAGVRTDDFVSIGAQKALNRFINDGYEIYKVGKKIIENFTYNGKVRQVSISISDLRRDDRKQLDIFEDGKKENLLNTLDSINNKYGEFTVARGSLMQSNIKKGVSGMGFNKTLSRNQKKEDTEGKSVEIKHFC